MHTGACLVALALAVAAGCATMGGYRPTVDPYNDPHAGRIPQDEAECRELAVQSSGGTAKKSTIGVVVGGLLGAASGAAIGAAAGSPGAGAAIGAATGGVGGGAYEGVTAEERFKHTFQECMRERGHNVLD
jgi:outer membrane lipoprotein SlyB